MARKLKTYETSLGFFDLAVAAPSMKAALEAWGATRNLFHDGVAKQSNDPDVIAATMAKPGVTLKRPVGSHAAFKEHAELPSGFAGASRMAGAKQERRDKEQSKQSKQNDQAADRKAALAFERHQKRRERERAKQEAAEKKERERRRHAIDKAQSALDAARRKHEKNVADMKAKIDSLGKELQAEKARWEEQRAGLEAALRQARD